MPRYRRKNKTKRIVGLVIVVVLIASGIGGAVYFKNSSDSNKHIENKEATKPSVANNKPVEKPVEKVVETPKNKYGYPEVGDNIIESAKAYAVPANEVFNMLESRKTTNHTKEVFLTFDDGPSDNTPQILNILKEENVHATFFVVGNNLKASEKNREYLKEAYEDGNAIANHTLSHNMHKLYPNNKVNVNYFMKEVTENDKLMRNILGDGFNTRVLRMPGGYMSRAFYHDSNLKALNEAFKQVGLYSIDWDAETGDATGSNIAPNKLVSTAIKESANKEHVVLLMHDAAAKKTTVTALKRVIQYYKNNGFEFKVISNPTK